MYAGARRAVATHQLPSHTSASVHVCSFPRCALTGGFVPRRADLALQCGLRGGDLHAIVAELRAKLWTVWRDGLAFWSVAHMVVFAQPIWWLQPFLGNLFTLVFNVYLAVTAHRPVQPPVQPPPPQLWNEQQQQTLQSQGLVSDSPPDAGGHELFHHPGRLVEAAAWQSALHRRQREGQPARSA